MTFRRVFAVSVGFLLLPVLAFAGSPVGPGITGEEALTLLREGNVRFVTGQSRHPHCDPARLIETDEQGQHPFATVIACSDSRVPVEILFDEGFGDLFVVRVAGNVCDADEAGSIEYGVEHLRTPLLVVLGHTSCGAVTAVATDAELHGNIPGLVDNIKPAVMTAQKQHPHLHGKDLVPAAIRANVWQGIEDLLQISPDTRELVVAGELTIVGALFDLHTGMVEWMGPHPRQKELLSAPHKPGRSRGEHHQGGADSAGSTEPHASPKPVEPAPGAAQAKTGLATSAAMLLAGMCLAAIWFRRRTA